jgi:hypothetical protein
LPGIRSGKSRNRPILALAEGDSSPVVTRHSNCVANGRRVPACQGAPRRPYSRVESAVGQSSRPVEGRFPWSSPIDTARDPSRDTLLNRGRPYRSTLNRAVPPVRSPARDCIDPRALPVLRHAAPDAKAGENRGGSERRCARGEVQARGEPGQRQLIKSVPDEASQIGRPR